MKLVLTPKVSRVNKTQERVYDFRRKDFLTAEEIIERSPFVPFCRTNPSLMLEMWYQWLDNILKECTTRKTKLQAQLPPPWITPRTSHLMKKINIMRKRRNNTSQYRAKTGSVSNLVETCSEEDLAN